MPLLCSLAVWPTFSGESAEFDRLKGSLLSLEFNALEHSQDDLAVIMGEIFQQVRHRPPTRPQSVRP